MTSPNGTDLMKAGCALMFIGIVVIPLLWLALVIVVAVFGSIFGG